MSFAINPHWKYIPISELRLNPVFKLLLSEFDHMMQESTHNITVRLYTRDEMITRYVKALRFWIHRDPLKLYHLDVTMENLHDMGRIENSLVYKKLKDNPMEQELSKICGTIFNYIYHRLSTYHHEFLSEVRAQLLLHSKF